MNIKTSDEDLRYAHCITDDGYLEPEVKEWIEDMGGQVNVDENGFTEIVIPDKDVRLLLKLTWL